MVKRYQRPDGAGCFLLLLDFFLVMAIILFLLGMGIMWLILG